MPTFDALTYAQRLQAGGISESDATSYAEALREVYREQESPLATKTTLAELRAEFAGLRADVRTEISGIRTEVSELRTEVQTAVAGVRTDWQGQDSEIKGEV